MENNNNKRIAKNTMMLYFRMLLTMAIGLYTSRIVLKTLGVEDFGLYNIIGGIVVLFSFLNNSMTSATQRFLNFEMGRNDHLQMKKVFSASVNIHITIALSVIILAETVGLWFVNTQLNIPEDRFYAAGWVYQFTILSFTLSVLKVPYNATIISNEQMSFYAYISIVEVILKLLIVFLLNYILFDKLILYSILTMLVGLFMLLVCVFYCVRKYPSSRYIRVREKALYKQLLSFSGWSIFGSIANIGKTQGINVLINIFCGVSVNAAVSVSNQIIAAVNSFVSNFQIAFNPQITKSYAANDKVYLFDLIFKTSKYSFFLLFALSLPILLNTNEILNLWLTTVPKHTVGFCRMSIVYMLIESISGPLWMTVQATGRIKKYQIVISSLLLLNIPIAYLLLKFKFPPYYVIGGSAIIGIFALTVRLVFLYSLALFPVKLFISKVLMRILLVVTVSYAITSLVSSFIQNNLIGTILSIASTVIITLAVIYFAGMNTMEKSNINKQIAKRL
ncbi:MAG: lipopolysaccharide biosynthesis protein [Paludibacteraceae bacterium]